MKYSLRKINDLYIFVCPEYKLEFRLPFELKEEHIQEFLDFKEDGWITEKLIKENLQIACMESCTSGLIASTITDYPGSSAVLKGSLITYSNEYKIYAGVNEKVIEKYGVYSLETANEMALKAKEIFKADIAIGITGSFSNVDPNNKDSVAGEVYFMISEPKSLLSAVKLTYHNLDVSRKEIKAKTVNIVLAFLKTYLSNI